MSADIESRIRKRAHEIWEGEGRPEGREKDHWDRAEAEVKAADKKNGKAARPTVAKPAKKAAPEKPAKQAASAGKKASSGKPA